tara:strand:+ start:216 stop:545 length:330 start_codon:yes stop_codon:yes gene_type:complete
LAGTVVIGEEAFGTRALEASIGVRAGFVDAAWGFVGSTLVDIGAGRAVSLVTVTTHALKTTVGICARREWVAGGFGRVTLIDIGAGLTGCAAFPTVFSVARIGASITGG